MSVQLDLNIKMQKIISQIPELNPFLSRIPRSQHFQAVKHLVRLGLKTTQNYCCTQNVSDQSDFMRRQLEVIKENIEDLNNMVRQQSYNYCKGCQKNNQKVVQKEPQNSSKNNSKKVFGDFVTFEKKNEQKPVRDGYQVGTINYGNSQSINPFSKNKSLIVRRNLDDTGARQAMNFPVQILAEKDIKIKRKSQSFRKHIYQEQVNKQDLQKIKEEKGQSLDKLRRDRTISDYSRATSKIKPLIEKDRIRYTQTKREQQFQQGFNKYQYSDENQMEQSSMHEEAARAYEARLEQRHSQSNTYDKDLQSGVKSSKKASSKKSNNKTSSKKQFERSQKEADSKLQGSLRGLRHQSQSGSSKQRYQNERSNQINESSEQDFEKQQDQNQNDVISNSSSFSQFSMQGSRRKQVGKISRRSQNP